MTHREKKRKYDKNIPEYVDTPEKLNQWLGAKTALLDSEIFGKDMDRIIDPENTIRTEKEARRKEKIADAVEFANVKLYLDGDVDSLPPSPRSREKILSPENSPRKEKDTDNEPIPTSSSSDPKISERLLANQKKVHFNVPFNGGKSRRTRRIKRRKTKRKTKRRKTTKKRTIKRRRRRKTTYRKN